MKLRLLSKLNILSIAFLLGSFTLSFSQETPDPQDQEATEQAADDSGDAIEGDLVKGKELFDKNCTACHKIDGDLVGPEMRNVVERVKEEGGVGRQWLHDWIRDNNALRESGDAYAIKVFEDYNKVPMLTFPNLSDQELDDILAYTSDPEGADKAAEEAKAAAKADSAAASGGAGTTTSRGLNVPIGLVVTSFIILALLLFFILFRLSTLVRLVKIGGDEIELTDEKPINFAKIIKKNEKAFGIGLGVLTLLALWGLWQFMFLIGVDKGYQPEQPIYFSHQVHAGVQGIDCQFCHSSAKYSKVSGIPSPNLCMNCHKSIKEYSGDYYEEELVESGRFASADDVKDFYTSQIHKMYDAIGWDPDAQDFTGEQKPIEWVRIHNMPDFVYFSHQQHVVAGENAILKAIKDGSIPNSKELALPDDSQVCFACHGDVSKMDEVEMANDFTMGWCIECHRTTEVDMSNEFNSSYYADLHEKLKKEYGENARVTVDAIGGMECAKCHY